MQGSSKTTRRGFIGGLAGLRVVSWTADYDFAAQWALFRARFMAADGRIIDTGNNGISHSEGQSYGLLAALHADDQEAFDLIFDWTHRNLYQQSTGLHAWRFDPGAKDPVSDRNNATDGDLGIAWALSAAGRFWSRRGAYYTQTGRIIAAAILRHLTVQAGKHLLLLPGACGFSHPQALILNPSYYIFPALSVLAAVLPDPAWARLSADGMKLLAQARFGRWGLPADWIEITTNGGPPLLPSGRQARFSYDAVRVPLYLAWAGLDHHPALCDVADFWQSHPGAPAEVDLADDHLEHTPAGNGMLAVRSLALRATGLSSGQSSPPSVSNASDYYDAALGLLARMATKHHTATLSNSRTLPRRAAVNNLFSLPNSSIGRKLRASTSDT